MKLRLKLPTSVPGQFFFGMAIILAVLGVIVCIMIWSGYVAIAV